MSRTGIILLAAGASTRMDRSKQMLDFKGAPLLFHAASQAIHSGFKPIVVVLGDQEALHRKVIIDLPLHTVVNKEWEKGLGTSIKAGLNYLLLHHPSLEAVIVMVCDQPAVTGDHLKKLEAAHLALRKSVIASQYAGTSGVPALFAKPVFADILNLSGDQGAKKIITANGEDAASVDLPGGEQDLDTPGDYERFGG